MVLPSLMAHTAALYTSATFALFNRWGIQRGKLFPGSSAKFASSSLVLGIRRNGFRVVSFSATGKIEGNVEISEDEVIPHNFAWPDKKKPRVCILGGGFGGLYTALRLESLVWPDDKKPQEIIYLLSSQSVECWMPFTTRGKDMSSVAPDI